MENIRKLLSTPELELIEDCYRLFEVNDLLMRFINGTISEAQLIAECKELRSFYRAQLHLLQNKKDHYEEHA